MTTSMNTRPKRLWVAALMNTMLGGLALFTLGYIAFSSSVPTVVRPTLYTAVLGGTTATLLVVSSILALLGKPRSPYFMLASALLFYGLIVVQNAVMLYGSHDWLSPMADKKLTASVVRGLIEILINVWALLTVKTRNFFAAAAP